MIPPTLCKELLDKIHEGHQGITKCRERARQSLWWPGLSRDLEELVRTCTKCCKAQKQRAQPMTPSPLHKLPWQGGWNRPLCVITSSAVSLIQSSDLDEPGVVVHTYQKCCLNSNPLSSRPITPSSTQTTIACWLTWPCFLFGPSTRDQHQEAVSCCCVTPP